MVASHGDGFLWDIVVAEETWLRMTCDALDLVLRECRLDWNLQGASHGTLLVVANHAADVKGLLRRYCRACVSHDGETGISVRKQAERVSWCRAGDAFVLDRMTIGDGHTYLCGLCAASFKTKAAKAAHAAAVHGQRALASFAFGTMCQICGTEFWQGYCLRQHLRVSRVCADVYSARDIVETMSTSSKAEQGCHGAWRPPCAVQGLLGHFETHK